MRQLINLQDLSPRESTIAASPAATAMAAVIPAYNEEPVICRMSPEVPR